MQCGYDNNLHRAWKITRKLPWSHWDGVCGETCVLVCETPIQMKILKTEITLLLLIYNFKKRKCNEAILFCSDVLSRFPSFLNYINFYEFNFLQILICTYRPTHVFMCRYTYMCLCIWKPEDSSGCHPQKSYLPALK